MMKRVVAFVLIGAFVSQIGLGAVDGKKAQYVGGTLSGVSENAEGRLNTSNDEALIFTPDKKKQKPVTIPYAAITELEYGQKAGRRVAMAILISPFALFSKKRKHYLTLSYTDAAGKDQAAVFELGKDIVRTTLKIIETRSGKDIQYQDEDARKSGVGGSK